jgi:hypothetical protein
MISDEGLEPKPHTTQVPRLSHFVIKQLPGFLIEKKKQVVLAVDGRDTL